MKKAPYLLIALLALGCAKETVDTPEAPVTARVDAVAPSPIIDGEVIAYLDEGLAAELEQAAAEGTLLTRSDAANHVFSALGIASFERVFPDAGIYEERTRREGLHRFYHFTFRDDIPLTRASESLSGVPGVLSVEPVRRIVKRTFDDPRLSQQWHYVNTAKEGADINVQKVWDAYTTGSSDVIVSVVDGGVDLTHEDLRDNVIAAGENGSRNFVKGNYTISADDHGTHVAGVVAAVNNNGKGGCGIAGGDAATHRGGARILSCQIFEGYSGASDSQTAAAMKWGADHGALVLQCSWGYSADVNEDGKVSSSELADYKTMKIPASDKAAIDYFIKYAGCDKNGDQLPDSKMQGGLVFFAAGNENIDYDPICAYEPVIAVGAFGKTGKKASYSNYGDWVDLGAPGGDGSANIISTLPGNKYGGNGWQGTSMACPHASGVAALLISFFGGEGFTQENCRTYLLEGAVQDYFSTDKPIGAKLDAYGAFARGLQDMSKLFISFDSAGPTQIKAHETISLPLSVTYAGSGTFSVKLDDAPDGVSLQEQNGLYQVVVNAPKVGEGDYTITASATSSEGDTITATTSITILPNHAPKAAKKPQGILLDNTGLSLNLEPYFTDEDGEALSFSQAGDETSSVFKASVSGSILSIRRAGYGRDQVTVRASDFLGASCELSFPVISKDPSNPVDVYPTVVTDVVNIDNDSTTQVSTEIVIALSSGRNVYKKKHDVSVYNPAQIDMSAFAPGVYTATVTYNSTTYRRTFTKI